MQNKTIAVTGAGGFIGFHLVNKLIQQGHNVIAIDSLEPAYGGKLSELRWQELSKLNNIFQKHVNLVKIPEMELLEFLKNSKTIYHLAAFPGVRQSETKKDEYYLNNVIATRNILKVAKKLDLNHFFLASSSSIYGDINPSIPALEKNATGTNLKSFYAKTKWENELDATSFAQNSAFPLIVARFFTVYGPYGRPDMAYWSFAQKIESGKRIDLYGSDGGSRNYTFIDDAVEMLIKLLDANFVESINPVNIASGEPKTAKQLAETLTIKMEKPICEFNYIPRPEVDVEKTWADTTFLSSLIGELPYTSFSDGLGKFASWYLQQRTDLRDYK
jgi:UDP-glucuronate 4-epimerase